METLQLQQGDAVGVAAPRTRPLEIAALVLFAIALAMTCVHGIRSASEPFDYPHAFDSADVATTARTFADVGVWKLHGVPVNNNPPIGSEDSYTHWPPLLPVLLSLCFRAFGLSERVAHLFMLCILLSTAALIFCVGRRWLGATAGALAGFFWLTLPVTLQFGHMVVQQQLMTFFMVAAVLAFLHGRNGIGSGLLFLGALSSWEIVLVALGLLLGCAWRPELRRSAVAAAIGAGVGIVLVAGIYLHGSPGLALDTLQAAKFYMGLSTSYSHVLLPAQITIGAGEQVRRMLMNNVLMLGPLGIGAVIQLFLARDPRRVMVLAVLATPWLVWCVVMRNHMARHAFELILAGPVIALALAWLATTPSRRPALKAGLLTGLVIVQMLLLPKPAISDGYDPAALIRYAQGIRDFTEPDSVVMAPLVSAVPLYYSERHIVRGIFGDADVALVLPGIRREFPGSSVYLAIPPFLASSFSGGQVAATNRDVIVIRIADGQKR